MPLDQTTRVLQHNKQREQETLRRKAGSVEDQAAGGWLYTVPFAGVGMTNTRLSIREIANFAWSAMLLDPVPGDLVLDLGAGSCWVSEWLNRLLVDTVSLDISLDMLAVGQHRLGSGARLTGGDFERLPYADAAFNGAICLSALHHVPNIPQALREIYRVLREDGVAVFSEPGRGHSNNPQSRTEMVELGVMERDIIVPEILAECHRAGFKDVTVTPFLFPGPAYNLATWQYIEDTAPATSRSPGIGAALTSRIRYDSAGNQRGSWRLFGRWPFIKDLARDGHPWGLFRERRVGASEKDMLARRSLEALHSAADLHPLVVVRKGPRIPTSRRPSLPNASIDLISAAVEATPGGLFTLDAVVYNTGDTLWLCRQTPYGGFVALGAKLVDESGMIVVHDYGRGYLGQNVPPGAHVPARITLTAPVQPGRYQVKLDMVDEGVSWFEHWGARAVYVSLDVRA